MDKNRTSNAEKWRDRYEASKSAAQAIIDKEAEAMRARTNRLREQRGAQPTVAPIANSGAPTPQAPIEAVQAAVQSSICEPTALERRRKWTDAEKLKILEEVAAGGDSISEIAHRHDVSPQVLHHWQKRFASGPREPNAVVLPMAKSSEAVGEETEVDVHVESPQFDVPVNIARVKVTCRGGRVLTVDANIVADVLKTLIRAVEEA
jgi:transposase